MEAARFPWPALGVLLVRDGLVTVEALQRVLSLQGDDRGRRVSSRRLGEALVENGIVTSAQVARLVAEQHELPFVDLESPDAIVRVPSRIPEAVARRHTALPIRLFPDGSLLVVVADPTQPACFDDIRHEAGVPIRFAVAAPEGIRAAIDTAAESGLFQPELAEAVEDAAEEPPLYAEPERPADAFDARPAGMNAEQSWPAFGSLLLRSELVSEAELEAALAQQRLSSTRRLGEILISRGALTDEQVAQVLAEQHELPFVDLRSRQLDVAAGRRLPTELARRHGVLPIASEPDGSLLVAVADPASALLCEELRAALAAPLRFAVATPAAIHEAIDLLASGVHAVPEPELDPEATEAPVAETEPSEWPFFHEAPPLVLIDAVNDAHDEPEAQAEQFVAFDIEPVTEDDVDTEAVSEAAEPDTAPEPAVAFEDEIEVEVDAEMSESEPEADVTPVQRAFAPTYPHAWMFGDAFRSAVAPDASAEVVPEPETELAVEDLTETEVELEVAAETEPDADADVLLEAEREVEVEAEPDFEPAEVQSEAELAAEVEVEVEVEAELAAEVEVEVEVEAEVEVTSETESEFEFELTLDDPPGDPAPEIPESEPVATHHSLFVDALVSALRPAAPEPAEVHAESEPEIEVADEPEASVEAETAVDTDLETAVRAEVDAEHPDPMPETEEVEPEHELASPFLQAIESALALDASSVHFTRSPEGIVVRARVTESLTELQTIARTDADAAQDLVELASRGRIAVHAGERPVELRSVVLQTMLGERATFRVVGDRRTESSLSDLVDGAAATLTDALAAPGLFVVGGPAGSGRTTTLYAALHELVGSAAVLTIEDPVEGLVPGADQMEVDLRAGLTYAAGLHAILRSDPDVVAVGELLDPETARLAARAAMSGRRVLSTVESEGVADTVRRLLDLGIESGALAAGLTGVVAQRLLRRFCIDCREAYYASAEELVVLGLGVEEGGRRLLGRGQGCHSCDGTGYRGHVAAFEVLPLDENVRAAVSAGATAAEIERAAIATGMQTLRDVAVRLCLEGATTVAEVRGVPSHAHE
jgi:type IV pilus assembly protein PilB